MLINFILLSPSLNASLPARVPWSDFMLLLPGVQIGLWALLVAAVASLSIHVLQNLLQPALFLPPYQPPRFAQRILRLLGPGVLGLVVSLGYAFLNVPAIPMAMPLFMVLSGLVIGGLWTALRFLRAQGPVTPYLWNIAAWGASFLAIGCLY